VIRRVDSMDVPPSLHAPPDAAHGDTG
jgi:hypothetical protein